jgi:hypothetical protein
MRGSSMLSIESSTFDLDPKGRLSERRDECAFLLDSAARNSADNRLNRQITIGFWIAVVLLGGMQCWASRHSMNTDGISYLDIASSIAQGNWKAALHAYWSPLYACLLAGGLALFRPSPYWEFPVVHLVNFLVFLATAGSFQFFMIGLNMYRRQHGPNASRFRTSMPERAMLLLGYSLFVSTSLTLINLSTVSPDLTFGLFIFLASGITLRMKTEGASVRAFALLGAVLGFGYLAKTPMMPLSLVFFVSALFAAISSYPPIASSQNYAKLLRLGSQAALGISVFLLVVVPFVSAISTAKRRFTIGDNARLNWAWNINHLPRYHWQGDNQKFGTPLHPARKVFTEPAVYVFDGPLTATYAAWYDPSYWYDGYRPVFDIGSVVAEVVTNSYLYYEIFFGIQAGIAALWIFLFLNGGQSKTILQDLAERWLLLLPAIAALAMYAIVYAEKRYLAPFVVLLWMGLFSALHVAEDAASRRAIRSAVAVAVVLTFIASAKLILGSATPNTAPNVVRWKAPYLQFEISQELHKMGIEPGDKVAWIRPKVFNREQNYEWARLTRVRIIAEIPGSDEGIFWAASACTQSEALKAFDNTGAKALIATKVPEASFLLPWRPIGATGYYLIFLRN